MLKLSDIRYSTLACCKTELFSRKPSFKQVDRQIKADIVNHTVEYARMCVFGVFVMRIKIVKGYGVNKYASSPQNLSSGFPTKRDSNQSPQLQRLAKKIKFRL